MIHVPHPTISPTLSCLSQHVRVEIWVRDGSTKEEKSENKKLNKCCLTAEGFVWHFAKWRCEGSSLSRPWRLAKSPKLKIKLTATFSGLCICGPLCISLYFSLVLLSPHVFYLLSLPSCLSVLFFQPISVYVLCSSSHCICSPADWFCLYICWR